MKMNRRDFLKISGTAGVSAALSSAFGGGLRAFSEAEEIPPISWDEVRYTACAVCDNTCAMKLHMKGGKIKEIVGNPADLLGGYGKVCVKGASAMRILYDPARLKAPIKRTNPKKGKDEDPGWVKISWEEAYETIGEKFGEAISEHGPESVMILGRPKEPETRLQKAIGTPNQICHVDTCYLNHDVAWKVTWGSGRSWCLDMENAKYLMSFGYDQPGKTKLSHLETFLRAKDNGAKVVVFDPRLSRTANMADEWFPIKPGTDLAVTLAMMNVIISEELYDKEYVASYTYGLDRLAKHVKQYTPGWASQISGVAADDISRIAREFATTRPAMIPTHKRDAGGPLYSNSFGLAQSEIILCALAGTIERPGGFYVPRTPKGPKVDQFAPAEYPPMTETKRVDGQDLFPIANKIRKGNFSHLAQGMLSGKPYPVKVCIAKQYNVLSFPNPDSIIEALKKLDLLVVVDILPNELCQLADIVLPDMHFLEKRGNIQIRKYHALWPQIMLRDGTGPLYDDRGWGGMVNGILEAMEKPEFKVNWKGLEEARLKSAGTSKEYLKAHNGIWEDKKPPTGKTEFSTSTKKLELYSTALEKDGYEPLPTWHEKMEQPTAEYPFYLLINHHPWFRMSKNVNDPLLMELQPANLLHLHPDVAAKMDVKTGDDVIVESSTKKPLRIVANVTRGIRPDCVMTEHAYGHWSKEMFVAHNKGTNNGDLIPERKIEDTLKIKEYNPAMPSRIIDVCVNVRKA